MVPVLMLQLAIRRIGSVLASIIMVTELPITIMLAYLFFVSRSDWNKSLASF